MIHLLLTYKYLILIPLSIIEGPIVTVVVGFLVTLHYFNPFVVYLVMVLGDIIGDGLIYYIGRSSGRLLKFFKVSEERLEHAKKYFVNNHRKALLMSKLVHGVGFTGLLAAGASHVPYKKYFTTCAIISMIQSLVMLLLGIFFGHAYEAIGKYLNIYAEIISGAALLVVIYIIITKYKDSLGKKIGS
jgi:membrane protein DedA with SNARE-associated domain